MPRLLKKYRPREAFTERAGLQLIGSKDPDNPQASFADHKHFISRRASIALNSPPRHFAYLIEKGELDPENETVG